MNLVIHDLPEEQWRKISRDYAGWTIVGDRGTIRPCTGCFSCWNRTPGKCVIRDGYENMPVLIRDADEITVISKYTYGALSGFAKNIFDRSLGYLLPQFEIINNETHHQRRYDEDKPFTFIFYGNSLTRQDQEDAERYVKALCANVRAHVKEVIFRESAPEAEISRSSAVPSGRAVLLNASMRSLSGNSAKFARRLSSMLKTETETVNLKDYLNDLSSLIRALDDASLIVLCTPVYADCLPSQLIRLMERFEHEYRGQSKRIYVLANMGLYESCQLVNLFCAVRRFCRTMNFEYCGGLGISAGELIGTLMDFIPFTMPPSNRIAAGMKTLALAIDAKKKTEDILAEPCCFPRSLFILIANRSWNITAKKNGLSVSDLYRRL